MNKVIAKHILVSSILFTFQIAFAKETKKYPEDVDIPKVKLGVCFTENKGQVHDQNYEARPDVLFGGADGNLVFHLRSNGISYQLSKVESWNDCSASGLRMGGRKVTNEPEPDLHNGKERNKSTVYRLDVNWLNTNPNVQVEKGRSYKGFDNYYFENCPNGVLNVQSYEEVVYRNIYNGIDLKWYQKEGHLKYDYLLSAGANYKQIQLELKGATAIKINDKGELIVTTPLGNIIEQAPLVIQNQKVLKAKWLIKNKRFVKNSTTELSCCVSFEIENLNPNQAFIIDPLVRAWGTYYGGNGTDYGRSTAIDAAGNVYSTGYTNTGAVMATVGAHQTINGGSGDDAFLVKFDASGTRQWATYYGGSGGGDVGRYCTIDAIGNIYMAGTTDSNIGTVIATAGAHQTSNGGGTRDAFLVKFNASGVRQWGTYYGGNGDDRGQGCTTDAAGNVYLAGMTQLSGTVMGTAGAHQISGGAGYDAFLVKFNSLGVRQWGTYYGGNGDDSGFSCATDASGSVYLAGHTDSNIGTVIASSGAHQTINGGSVDAFLVKFNALGVRQWGTYYGGNGEDIGLTCSTATTGEVYLAGYTASTGTVIATPGAYQTVNGGGTRDAFLVKFNSSGVRQWGTFYGGNGFDEGKSCMTDDTGNVFFAGFTNTNTSTVIATSGGYQTANGGGNDAFLVKFNALGVRQWGTYYGGNGDDFGFACTANATGDLYLLGHTDSNAGTAIATSAAHQIANGGGLFDAFLVKFTDCTTPANPIASNVLGCSNNTATLTATSGTTSINWYATPSSTIVLGTGTTYVTPALSAGSYTYYAEAFTCVPSITRTAIVLTVNTTPTITVNSGTICSGNTFTINPNGANTYTISGGSNIVTPTSNTSYSVTGTSALGCISTNTAISTVTVNPLPNITASSNTTLICIGQIATLTANGATTYTWSTSANTSTVSVSPVINTTYTVTGTDANGCSNLAIITQSVSNCTIINSPNAKQEDDIRFYPNPSKSVINIDCDTKIRAVKLIDNIGRELNIELINKSIDVSTLKMGLYYLTVVNDKEQVFVQKIIVH